MVDKSLSLLVSKQSRHKRTLFFFFFRVEARRCGASTANSGAAISYLQALSIIIFPHARPLPISPSTWNLIFLII